MRRQQENWSEFKHAAAVSQQTSECLSDPLMIQWWMTTMTVRSQDDISIRRFLYSFTYCGTAGKLQSWLAKKNLITIKLIMLGYCSACPSKNGYYYYGPDVHIYYNVTIVIRGICKLSKTSPGSGCFLRTPINTIFKIVCKERKVQKCKLMKSGWIFFKLDIC